MQTTRVTFLTLARWNQSAEASARKFVYILSIFVKVSQLFDSDLHPVMLFALHLHMQFDMANKQLSSLRADFCHPALNDL